MANNTDSKQMVLSDLNCFLKRKYLSSSRQGLIYCAGSKFFHNKIMSGFTTFISVNVVRSGSVGRVLDQSLCCVFSRRIIC